jgi:hypothetical protein
MALLERVLSTMPLAGSPLPEVKGWSEPPFWSLPDLRSGWAGSDREQIESSFEGYVAQAYKANGIVFACVLARLLPFSEARFQWQELVGGRPGRLFGNQELALLETPWAERDDRGSARPHGTEGQPGRELVRDSRRFG